MKYYTIQKLKAWNEVISKGFLTGNKEHIDKDWLLDSYLWMIEQMSKRLKDCNNEFPIWVWLDIDNINISDLLDEDWVLLEIDLPEDKVLLSNFEAWHNVLNDGYIGEENEVTTKEQSWEDIFDKDKMEQYEYDFEESDLQGVVGKIDYENIKVLEYILNEI